MRLQNTGNTARDSAYKEVEERIAIIDDFIYKETGKEHAIWEGLVNENRGYEAGELYIGENTANNGSTRASVAPWMGNPNTDTILRIQADFGETSSTNRFTRDKVTYIGKNLSQYSTRTFKEKFLEIQTSGTTITEQDEENIEYSLETVKGNKKLEIIYILQEE